MEIELDAFSGRPNPVWTLTDEEARELQALLAAATEPVAAPSEALGYRGFVVRAAADSPPRRVYAGRVQSGTAYRADTRDAEAWLIRYATAQGFAAVFAHLPQR